MINTLYSLFFVLLAVGAFACLPARASDPRLSVEDSATTDAVRPNSPQSSDDMGPASEKDKPAERSTVDSGVQYTSGGVGSDSIEALKVEEKEYNLKLLFAERGAYLASVKVGIADQRGHQILDTTTEGPILLVKLPPGTYNVTATRASGNTLNQRVKVTGNNLASYVIRFSGVDE